MNFNRRKALKIAAIGFMAVKAAVVLGHAVPGSIVTKAHAVTADQLMEPQALPDMVMGDANAPVTIVEYASMTCPHCAHFHETTLPALKEKYIDTGKVKLILREFPFDPRAAAAFMLARCAPPEQYFPMVDVLFKQQKTWASAENARRATAANRQTGRFYTGKVRGLLERSGTAEQGQGSFRQGVQGVWRGIDADLLHQWRKNQRRTVDRGNLGNSSTAPLIASAVAGASARSAWPSP